MSTNKSFIEFLLDQLKETGAAAAKKMFGEYMVYIAGKPVFLVCDDTVYVKIIPAATDILGEDCARGFPYPGAKEHYVADADDKEQLLTLAAALAAVLPLPKQNRKSSI